MEYYIIIQNNELELNQTFWKVFHGIMVAEISKMEKTTYNMTPFCATVITSCISVYIRIRVCGYMNRDSNMDEYFENI